jgi:hypothetical protein
MGTKARVESGSDSVLSLANRSLMVAALIGAARVRDCEIIPSAQRNCYSGKLKHAPPTTELYWWGHALACPGSSQKCIRGALIVVEALDRRRTAPSRVRFIQTRKQEVGRIERTASSYSGGTRFLTVAALIGAATVREGMAGRAAAPSNGAWQACSAYQRNPNVTGTMPVSTPRVKMWW